MKKTLLLFVLAFAFIFPAARADEGMWLPLLLEKMNIQQMQASGFKLTAADIYSVNSGSMKDAVCQFGGGCTAEVISDQGLLLTNHHCGYGEIQKHSSVEHNYIDDGFWAMNRSEEKVCPGLTVSFIIRMEDVTDKVLEGVTTSLPETDRQALIRKNAAAIEKKSIEGTHYDGFVRAFYNGNVYYLFVAETFKDVRLVGAPPVSIGNYGGDYDNWVWPRHTGDFSMFRIYADKNNNPAEYSADNVPFKPRRFFPIKTSGPNFGDFTLVYGFPGRTTEYLSTGGVNLIQNVSDPVKVDLRTIRINIMEEEMKKSEVVRIQYAAKRNGIANAWKKWQGEMLGLNANKATEKKRAYEAVFMKKLSLDSQQYTTAFAQLESNYKALEPWQRAADYMNEGCLSVEMIRYAESFRALVEESQKEKPDQEKITKLVDGLKKSADGWFKDYDVTTDKRIAVALFSAVNKGLDKTYQPALLLSEAAKNKGDYTKYIDGIYSKTMFVSKEKVLALLANWKNSDYKKIQKDPGYAASQQLYTHFRLKVMPEYNRINDEITRLNRIYMEGQMEVMKDRKFYPDANSTLRVAYGKVEGFQPHDGINYNWFTTLDGVMEKENPAIDEYKVPAKLKTLWETKDFGTYADPHDQKIHTCFIASNHTTGGNSGSPVIDAQGNLIGTNFDRVWEGTMSDVMFDPNRCRNIVLDVRYTLFIIDKFAGAGYLLNEMKLVK